MTSIDKTTLQCEGGSQVQLRLQSEGFGEKPSTIHLHELFLNKFIVAPQHFQVNHVE